MRDRSVKPKCIRTGCTNPPNKEFICAEHQAEREQLAKDFYSGTPTPLQRQVRMIQDIRHLHKLGR